MILSTRSGETTPNSLPKSVAVCLSRTDGVLAPTQVHRRIFRARRRWPAHQPKVAAIDAAMEMVTVPVSIRPSMRDRTVSVATVDSKKTNATRRMDSPCSLGAFMDT